MRSHRSKRTKISKTCKLCGHPQNITQKAQNRIKIRLQKNLLTKIENLEKIINKLKASLQ